MAQIVLTFKSDEDFGKYIDQLVNAAATGNLTSWFIVGIQHMIVGTDLPAPSLGGLTNDYVFTYKDEESLETALNAATFPATWDIKNKGAMYVLAGLSGAIT